MGDVVLTIKLPSEEFLPPVEKFNDTVGPLFAEFKNRFPLNEHSESGLSRSLGIFLNFTYHHAMEQLELLRPEPMSKEQWLTASPETKRAYINWQSNLKYLRQRNQTLMLKIHVLHVKRKRERELELSDDLI